MQQDWEPVIIRKTTTKTTTNKPHVVSKSNQVKSLESDEPTLKYIDKEVSQKIVDARVAKKLSRKQLAQGLMIPESVVADYETGKAIYNGAMISRFKKYLGVK